MFGALRVYKYRLWHWVITEDGIMDTVFFPMLRFPVFLVGAPSFHMCPIPLSSLPSWPVTMQKIKKKEINERQTEGYSTPVTAAGVCYNANMRAGDSWRLVMAVWGVKQRIKAECE